MTQNELLARIALLETKLAAQEASKTQIKLSAAGYVEVYGVKSKGRFSISIAPDGWDQVFAMQDQIKAFCKANKAACDAKLAEYKASKSLTAVG